MTPTLLQEIGLNEAQARAYLTLVESGELTPTALAVKIDQKRTNAYMILRSLEKLGLVELSSKRSRQAYQATNPIVLEKLSEQRRQEVITAETKIRQAMPALLSYYYSFTEKPGIRLVQGIDGLKEIYQDTLRTKQDIHLLRTTADIPSMTYGYLERYRTKRAQLGITTHALTPDTPLAREMAGTGIDTELRFDRAWLPEGSYTAPVEIDIYGTKTAAMIFGEDVMGVIIDSPALAEAMRQVFDLLRNKLTQ